MVFATFTNKNKFYRKRTLQISVVRLKLHKRVNVGEYFQENNFCKK